jgi:hypothetical protein
MTNRLQKDPCENEHHLTVEIAKIIEHYDDIQSKGSLGMTSKPAIVFLLPESTECMQMLSARIGLPGKLVEILVMIRHPFFQYARCAIMHPKSKDPLSQLEEFHIYLMSYGLTQIILAKPSLIGSKMDIVVLPESDDHPDGSPTDGEDQGDDLVDFGRKDIGSGL